MRWSNGRLARSAGWGYPALHRKLCELLLLVFFFHYKVVGDRECAGNAVGLHAGDLFIHLAGNYPFERDVPVFDDDVNGRNGTQLVLAEDLVAVDGAVGSAADLIIVNGGGQNLDVVNDFLDAFDVLDG